MSLLCASVVVIYVLQAEVVKAQMRGEHVTTTETLPKVTPSSQILAKSKRQRTLDDLLKNYDPRIPPNYEEGKTMTGPRRYSGTLYNGLPLSRILSVTTAFKMSQMNSMKVDYKMGMFLRQSWTDNRLKYTKGSKMKSLELDSRLMDNIWVPDLFLANEKDAKFHIVTVPNKLMHIYPEGRVQYSVRITATLQCNMDLSKYPLDSQICSVVMESYGYSTETLEFRWNPNPVLTDEKFVLAQFYFGEIRTFQCDKDYYEVNYTCITLEFEIRRNIGYYLTQIYIPSMLIVCLSWVSFWLDMEAVPARISLGLLTVLTMTTQSSGARASLPKVSYVKAIDVWMATCLLFVFAALIEFAFVNVYLRVEKRRRQSQLSSADKLQGLSSADNLQSGSGVDTVIVYKEKETSTFFKIFSPSREKARTCDRLSRTAFPLAFLVFNIVYWSVYTLWIPSNTVF